MSEGQRPEQPTQESSTAPAAPTQIRYLVGLKLETLVWSDINPLEFMDENIRCYISLPNPNEGKPSSAHIEVTATNHREAIDKANVFLYPILDLLSFVMRSHLMNTEIQFVLKDQIRKVKREVFRPLLHEARQFSYLDRDEYEFIKLVKARGNHDERVKIALNWIRNAYSARNIPEAFRYYWLAFETLGGNEIRQRTCSSHSQVGLICPECGQTPSFQTSSYSQQLALLQAVNSAATNRVRRDLSELRNKVFHGGRRLNVSDFSDLLPAIDKLRPAIVEALLRELGGSDVIHFGGVVGYPNNHRYLMICKFRTSMRSRQWAMDFPDDDSLRRIVDDPSFHPNEFSVESYEHYLDW